MRIGLNTSIVGGSLINPFAAYNIGGRTPQTIADFEADKYRANGTTSTAASLLTHTRAGTATYTDNTGTLQTAASGELRKDNHIWDGSSWVKRCLVEPQSTNLVTYSEDFTDPSWSKSGVTVSGNTLTATTAASNFMYKDPGYTSSTQYTAWAVVEDVNAGFAYVGAFDGVDNFGAMFDLSDGSFVGYRSGTTNDNNWIQDLGGGKYLIAVTFTTGTVSASSFGFVMGLSTNGNLNFASPTNGQQIIVHRTQVEASSVPTSYIPTAGATVTRPADALSIDSTLLPYDSTAMTIAMDGEISYSDESVPIFWRWQADTNNRLQAFIDSRGSLDGRVGFDTKESGVEDRVNSASDAYSPGINVPFNIASRHTSSDINGAVDGTALTANTTVTALPDLSATDFEIAPTGVVNIKSLRILGGYGATDAELEAATT